MYCQFLFFVDEFMKLVNQQEPLEGMCSRILDVQRHIYVLFICKFGECVYND